MASTPLCRSVFTLIVQPLKRVRIHAIPSTITVSFSCPTKLSSAAFYSTFETPISAHSFFENTPIARFLLNECGFSLDEANVICRRKPDLLGHKSYDNSSQTLLFLRDKGFHEIGTRKLFSKRPELLRSSFQDTIKPKVEFLEKIGLTGHKLSRTIGRYPRVLLVSISRMLEPRVCFLQSVLDPDLAPVVLNPESDKIAFKLDSDHSLTAYVISLNPRILASHTEKILVGFVKDVEGMGIKKGSKAFARAFLQLSKLSKDTVKKKLENLKELGFTEEEIGILIMKMPALLGLSEDKLRQNLRFLVEDWKLPRNAILGHPPALAYSIEKRLKPRLNALRALMMENKSSKKAENYLPVSYLSMSESEFHRKVVGSLAA